MKAICQRMLATVVMSACLLVAACGKNAAPPAANPSAAPARPTITISVAASTADVVDALARSFGEQTPATIQVNDGPSSGLATQILAGGPADLFLSANQAWADKIAEAGLAEASRALLTNKLVLVVPKGNPAAVKTPQDLLSPQVRKIALAGEKVPAGIYADQALGKLMLLDELVAGGKIARGQDVRNTLSFVERGEAEAGIVYSTDVLVAREVEVVHEFDPALHDEIRYVLVLLRQGAENPATRQFYEYLQSSAAEEVYTQAGFERIRGK